MRMVARPKTLPALVGSITGENEGDVSIEASEPGSPALTIKAPTMKSIAVIYSDMSSGGVIGSHSPLLNFGSHLVQGIDHSSKFYIKDTLYQCIKPIKMPLAIE